MQFTIKGVPPTVNTYWRRHGNIYFISQKGREYKKVFHQVVDGLVPAPFTGRISMVIHWTTPDKRKRDIDNILKPILDGMKGTIFEDDSQVEHLEIFREIGKKETASIVVHVSELGE